MADEAHKDSPRATVEGLSQRLPDTYLLIAAIGLLVFLAGYLVAPGQFEVREVTGADGRVQRLVDPESFRQAGGPDGSPVFSAGDTGPGLFNAVYEGLVSGSRDGGAVGIIAFILLTGGAFGIVMATGSVDRALRRLISNRAGGGRLTLAVLFVTFSLGGAVFGMGEEAIPFVMMVVPVLARLGYDSATAVLVTYAATQVGFATSWMNPFSVAIAQGIAGLPLLSGMGLRIGMWGVFTLFGVLFLLRHAGRNRVPPERADIAEDQAPPLGAGDWLVLGALALTVAWIVWGVVAAGYYLPEIATQFVVLGVACALAGCVFRLDGMTANGAAAAFRTGAQALLPAALVIGFARGIVYLMGGDDPTEPSLLNTLLHAGSESLGGLPAWLASWLMLLGQGVFNFFVTSGSGQAALTMPIMAPLSDLLGVTRQVAVLAFQLGDGLTNILVPTSAALMGCLGAARLEWSLWIRVAAPFGAGLLLLASVFVIGASLADSGEARPMLTLIRNAEVFSPVRLGKRDVLLAGHRILQVADSIPLRGAPLEVVDAAGQWLLPGFVDGLTHPCGGGGEGGFGNRTAEIEAAGFVQGGVTTPVGALGTDSVTRSLDVLYGKVMELRARGLSALMLNGSYRLPAATLTGDVVRDLVLVEPVIGTGEVAVSDHRSSQPGASELRRLAAEVHLGGTLSGKRGTVLVHVGDGPRGLGPIEEALEGSELPRWIFFPTHVNRNRRLLQQATRFAADGGYADITVSTTEHLIAAGEVPALQALREAIEAGAPAQRLTLSSDAGGSLPLYRNGELAGLQAASPQALLQALLAAIRRHPDLVEAVIAAMTRNPADAYGLGTKGRVEPGADADLLLLDPGTGALSGVYCAGRPLLDPTTTERPDWNQRQGVMR